MTPQELERHFDAYVVVQAQEALRLNDQQYQHFIPRLRALQQARRREVQLQRRATAELARMLRARNFDEARAREGLLRLRAIEERSCAERRRAFEELDQVLDTVQRARFRVFEEQVERRKVELVLRARRSAAAERQKK